MIKQNATECVQPVLHYYPACALNVSRRRRDDSIDLMKVLFIFSQILSPVITKALHHCGQPVPQFVKCGGWQFVCLMCAQCYLTMLVSAEETAFPISLHVTLSKHVAITSQVSNEYLLLNWECTIQTQIYLLIKNLFTFAVLLRLFVLFQRKFCLVGLHPSEQFRGFWLLIRPCLVSS